MTPEEKAAWNRRQHALIKLGGTWAIPRSGLVLQKTAAGFELHQVMPYLPEMAAGAAAGMDVPKSAEALKAWQREDFRVIQREFELAGLEFTDPKGLLNMTVYPTATCFDDAMYYMAWLLVNDSSFDPGAYRIVHGVCLLADGTPYAHAWIEKDGVEAIGCGVIDGERAYYYTGRRDYYRYFRPQELIRYTLAEVAMRATGGPWDLNFIQLCEEQRKR